MLNMTAQSQLSLLTLVVLSQSTLDVLCPYKGWTLYFSEGLCATI